MRLLIAVATSALMVASVAGAAEPEKAEAPKAETDAAPTPPPKKRVKPKIAVLDVRTGALDPKTFDGLSGLIASEVASRAPGVQVIGSGDIRAMVGFEREKQLMGCSESSCLAEIGGALGVEYMLTTEGGRTGGTWLINMVLLDVPKARPIKRLTQRTADEAKLVDQAVEGVKLLVTELPKDPDAPAAVEARPVEKRSKVVTWGLVGGGAVAVVTGAVLVGAGWMTRNGYKGDDKTGIATSVTLADARNANAQAVAGYVVGAVGIAAVVWGALRLGLPEAPAQVAIVPGPHGVHASVAVVLP